MEGMFLHALRRESDNVREQDNATHSFLNMVSMGNSITNEKTNHLRTQLTAAEAEQEELAC